MTVFGNTCEGNDGTSVSTLNSAPGSDNWHSVSKGASALMEYDADRKASGATSILFSSPVASERAYVRWENFTPACDSISTRFYAYIPSLSGVATIFSAQGAGSIRVASLAISTSGFLNVTDSMGQVHSSAGTIDFSTWLRFEVVIEVGMKKTSVRVYKGHNTVPEASLSVDAIASDFGEQVDRVVYGKYGTGYPAQFWLDEIALETDTNVPIGPIQGGVASFMIKGVYVPETDVLEAWEIDASLSTGTTTLVQTAGPATTIIPLTDSIYSVTNPEYPGDIVLLLTATAGGSVSRTITLIRTDGAPVQERPYRLTFQGGDAANISNWA